MEQCLQPLPALVESALCRGLVKLYTRVNVRRRKEVINDKIVVVRRTEKLT